MSSYTEFKSDVKHLALSYILASIIIWVFKILITIITLGVIWMFNKNKTHKTYNKNFYKI
jgi:hypothetical protein